MHGYVPDEVIAQQSFSGNDPGFVLCVWYELDLLILGPLAFIISVTNTLLSGDLLVYLARRCMSQIQNQYRGLDFHASPSSIWKISGRLSGSVSSPSFMA